MSNLYELMQQIHELLPKVAEKIGRKIGYKATQSDYIIFENGATYGQNEVFNGHNPYKDLKGCFKLYAPQIRQILVACEEVLGENPEYLPRLRYNFTYLDRIDNELIKRGDFPGLGGDFGINQYALIKTDLEKYTQSQAQALCQRWLDGLDPLFDQTQEIDGKIVRTGEITVLTELVEVLESLLK